MVAVCCNYLGDEARRRRRKASRKRKTGVSIPGVRTTGNDSPIDKRRLEKKERREREREMYRATPLIDQIGSVNLTQID